MAVRARRRVVNIYSDLGRCSRRNAFKNKGIFGQDGTRVPLLHAAAERAD